MNSGIGRNERVIDEHQEFLKSIGDGVIEGVREGMKSGAIKGSKRGLVAGVRDCLAKGLMNIGEGDYEDVAEFISVSSISGDIEAATSGGPLDEVSNAIIRQIRGRVRSADRTQRAINHIKGRMRDELPNNPLSNAIVGRTQRALDEGLNRGIEPERERLEHEELKKGKAKENVRKIVKSVVEEVVAAIFYRVARQITKRSTAKLRKELKEKALRRLEQKLSKTAEQKLEHGLDKSIKQLTEEVFKDCADEMSFATNIDGSFGDSFKSYLSSLARGPRFPFGRVFLIVVGVLAIAGIVYALRPGIQGPVTDYNEFLSSVEVEQIDNCTIWLFLDADTTGSYEWVTARASLYLRDTPTTPIDSGELSWQIYGTQSDGEHYIELSYGGPPCPYANCAWEVELYDSEGHLEDTRYGYVELGI